MIISLVLLDGLGDDWVVDGLADALARQQSFPIWLDDFVLKLTIINNYFLLFGEYLHT